MERSGAEQTKTAPRVKVEASSESGTSRNWKSAGTSEEGNGSVKSGERSGGGRWRKARTWVKNRPRSAAHSPTNRLDLWNGFLRFAASETASTIGGTTSTNCPAG